MSGAAFRGAISHAVATALELHRAGMSTREAANAAGCSHSSVCRHLYGKAAKQAGCSTTAMQLAKRRQEAQQ